MAEENADGKRSDIAYIIIVALAERLRAGMYFETVPDDRLITALYEIRYTRIDDSAKLPDLEDAVVAELKRRQLYEQAVVDWIEPQFARGCERIDGLWKLLSDADLRHVAIDRAADWLARYPGMAADRETELVDRLIGSSRADLLEPLLQGRRRGGISAERAGLWHAVAFLVDFEPSRAQLTSFVASDKEWIWTLRGRFGGDRGDTVAMPLSAGQLEWATTIFRPLFPFTYHQPGSYTGHRHAWDASDFVLGIAARLSNLTDDASVAALRGIAAARTDGYTPNLRALLDAQQRKVVEDRYAPPPFRDFKAIMSERPPQGIDDLRATMRILLEEIQARVRADPQDSWRGFYKDDKKSPHDEERCRDYLLTMLGPRPEHIELLPEGHMAADKRADIIALLNGMRLPVEIKGQWHGDLWHAADTQLDRLYTTDYAAERRGIYLVLWFGYTAPSRQLPRARGRGERRPASPAALKDTRSGSPRNCSVSRLNGLW